MDSGRTMAVHFYILAREGISMEKAYATSLILVLSILLINVLAYYVMHKAISKYSWGTVNTKIAIERLRLSFGNNEVIKNITINVYKNTVTGFMGPSGSGKSTIISVINRMIDFEDNVKIKQI